MATDLCVGPKRARGRLCFPRGFLGPHLFWFCPQWRSICHSQAFRPKRRIDAAAGYRGLCLRSAMLTKGALGVVVDINLSTWIYSN